MLGILCVLSVLIILLSPAMAVCDGYAKKAPIEINTSEAATDYQILLNITYDSDMQADFDDLCFTNEEDNAELDYFLEAKVNSAWASVWVEIDSIDTGNGTQAYIYYGKADATSSSNADATLLLYDDFNDGSVDTSKWVTSGSITEASGYIAVGCTGYSWCYMYSKKNFSNSYYIRINETWSNGGTGNGWAFVHGYGTGMTNGNQMGYYLGTSVWVGKADGTTYTSWNNTPPAYVSNQKYKIEIFQDGTHTEYYVDDTLVINLENSTENNNNLTLASSNYGKWDGVLAAKWIYPEPDFAIGSEMGLGVGPAATITSPENKTYYTISIPYNISTSDVDGDDYDCNVSYDGSVIDNLTEHDESAIGTISSTDGYHNVSVYCLDDTGKDSNTTVYFTIYSGFNISVTYGNGTAATNWNISVTNGSSNYTDINLSNPTLIRWDDLPVGSINITVDDGSDTLYYFQNTTSKTNNNTNFETLNLTIYEKSENTIVLTSSPGWSVTETNSVTISCSATQGSTSIYRDGIYVSNPYSSTLTRGSYIIICNTTETELYQPAQTYNTLQITSPYGCYDNETFAFSVTISTDTNITTINLTDQVNQNLIKPDLSDVYAPNVTETWINLTGGYYVVTNNTNLTEFTLYFGNYPISRTHSNHSLEGDVVNVSTYSQENSYYQLEYYEEISNEHRLINATLQVRVECSLGANYFDLENETILIASEYNISDINTVAIYSPTEVYSRSLIPECSTWYSKFYMVDEVQVTQTKMTLVDYSREFSGAKLSIKKQMEGLQRTMTEGYLDSENKLIVYLALEESYQIYLSNDDETRSIGLLYADSVEQEKTITLYSMTGYDLLMGDINQSFYYNNASGTINYYFHDPSSNLISVEFYVYNQSSGNLLYNSTVEDSTTASFIYAVPDLNGTYRARAVIHHPLIGVNTTIQDLIVQLYEFEVTNPFEVFPFTGNLTKYCYDGACESFNLSTLILSFSLIGIAMIFSVYEGAYAGFACTLFAMMTVFMGWWEISTTLLVIALVLSVLNIGKREA